MTAVIDASALVAYCLREEGLNAAKIKEHLRNGVTSIALIRTESANAILVSKRRKIIDESAAELSLSTMLELSTNNIKMMPEDDELISHAFAMSKDSDLAIYDLLYLSLAKGTDSSLLSKDDRQVREAKKFGIGVEDI